MEYTHNAFPYWVVVCKTVPGCPGYNPLQPMKAIVYHNESIDHIYIIVIFFVYIAQMFSSLIV